MDLGLSSRSITRTYARFPATGADAGARWKLLRPSSRRDGDADDLTSRARAVSSISRVLEKKRREVRQHTKQLLEISRVLGLSGGPLLLLAVVSTAAADCCCHCCCLLLLPLVLLTGVATAAAYWC